MISIICAIAKNRAIGYQNRLLWHLPGDLKHFKETTSGHPVIMGQKTYESIGRPLPNRINIILTKDEAFSAEGCVVAHSLEEAFETANANEQEVFVIGGGQVYAQALPFADRLYLTIIDEEPEQADTYFPDYSEFKNIISKEAKEENGIKYDFIELSK